VKRILFVLSLACFFIALARPQYDYRWQEVKRKGVDIVVAIDVSRSMLTQDVKPSRLDRAKLAVRDLVDMADGDRLALIPFAGSAYVMCPPTLDYDMFLQSLDTLSPDMMPVPGTDLATAMRAGEDLLGKAQGNKKIMILLTDGEDLEGSALTEAKRAASQGIVIYTVGIGTPTGDLIPVPNESGGVDFLKDEKGQIVKSRLDETMLKKIAELTEGSYALQSSAGGGVEKIYNDKIQIIPKQELSSRMEKIPLERFGWPLAAGMLLLAAEFLTRERKTQWFTRKKSIPAAALTAMLLLMFGLPLVAHANSAPDAKDRQEFAKLVEKYKTKLAKHPDDPVLNYDYGTANYKLGHYQLASEALQKALSADDLKLQNQAYYNYGNSLYRRGETTEKSDPDATRKLWQQSVQAYQGALKLNEKDQDAKYNMEFVQKRLNELPPPQQNQDKDKDKQDQKDQKDQQQQQNQSQQDKNQSDKDKQQQNQDQNQQQQNSGDKNNQSQQNQQQNQNNSQNQQDKQNQQGKGQQDQNQPQKQDANGKPQSGKDQKDQQNPGNQQKQQGSQDQQPGGMSKEQAQAALDSLKGEDRPYNMSMPNYQNQSGSQKDNKKDW
jgi:Ca-activated chloride channel family protein